MFTLAALIGSSDLLCIMPVRLFALLQKCWPLESIPLSQLTTESVEISLHYNKLSLRDPVLENVINVIPPGFPDPAFQRKPLPQAGQKAQNNNYFTNWRPAGCLIAPLNDILPVVRSKIVDNYNIPLN